jgi:uncharacterized protein
MSAPNSNPSERESDAMRRAQRTHEPSMEEILASIRAIIADDREAESPKAASKAAGMGASPVADPAKDAAPVREAEGAPARVEVSSATVDALPAKSVSWRLRTEPSSPKAANLAAALVVKTPPEIEPAPPAMPEPEMASSLETSDAPLLSEAADRAVTASFEELSSTLALHNAELVESLTREMLRPMIRTWLDDNLPALVERLVRAEIQRVARGGR